MEPSTKKKDPVPCRYCKIPQAYTNRSRHEKKCRGRGDSARRSRRESKRHRKRSRDRYSRSSSRSNRDTTPPKTRDENDEEREEALSGSSVLGSTADPFEFYEPLRFPASVAITPTISSTIAIK